MPLHIIIGPMKSSKSLELIAQIAPYQFSDLKVGLYQPTKNVRDDSVRSRIGSTLPAKKIDSLHDVDASDDVIGIDEIHMFEANDTQKIADWLAAGKTVYASGLDTDYRGQLMPIVHNLFALKPDTITLKKAVCEQCHQYSAVYTQIALGGNPLTKGLPAVVPEDGSYSYSAVCRDCFVRA